MSQLIAIKGSRDGLRLHLDEDAPWDAVIDALREQLRQGSGFFAGAQLSVDVGERALEEDQLAALMALTDGAGIKVLSLLSMARESRDAARAAGVTPRAVVRTPQPPVEDKDDAQFVQKTLRSGQRIHFHGHVTLMGDVNPGAEIIAGGNIIVWGRMRGSAHAGAMGDRTAVVCAIELVPTQLRIADIFTPDAAPQLVNGRDRERKPEVASIEGERITVETWDTYKK